MRRVRLWHQCLLVALLAVLVIYYLLKGAEHRKVEDLQYETEKPLLEHDYVLQTGPKITQLKLKTVTQRPEDGATQPVFFVSKEEPLHGAKRAFLKTLRGKTPIFVYPPEVDSMISSRVKDYGIWEEDLLNATAKIFLNNQESGLVFLDIGCNIGVYTLFIAKLGATVVAVDPVVENLRLLSKSLQVGNLAKNVTLINNAISNTRRNAFVIIPDKNVGGAYISDSESEAKIQPVRTIVLDDLAPLFKGQKVFMKMDIEGHEYNALSSAQSFFQSVNVRGILMEWVHHRYKDTGERIVSLLVTSGFLPYEDADKEKLLHPASSYSWPENVFWMKR